MNIGGGMSTGGTFKAPLAGQYLFTVSGTNGVKDSKLALVFGGDNGSSFEIEDDDSSHSYRSVTREFVVALRQGDDVYLKAIDDQSSYIFYFINSKRQFVFRGEKLD